MAPSTGQLWLLTKQCKRYTITLWEIVCLFVYVHWQESYFELDSLSLETPSTKQSALKVHSFTCSGAFSGSTFEPTRARSSESAQNDGNHEGFMRTQSAEDDCVIRSKASEQASKWALCGDCFYYIEEIIDGLMQHCLSCQCNDDIQKLNFWGVRHMERERGERWHATKVPWRIQTRQTKGFSML